jgi:hypothetical protein
MKGKLLFLIFILPVSLSIQGCDAAKKLYVKTYEYVHQDELFQTATEDTAITKEELVYDCSKEQAIIAGSKRLKNIKIPSGMQPLIVIDETNIEGKIVYSTPYGEHAPDGCEYFHLTQGKPGQLSLEGAVTGDSVTGWYYKDSRWNKHFGKDVSSVVVVLVKDRSEILAYSKVKTF